MYFCFGIDSRDEPSDCVVAEHYFTQNEIEAIKAAVGTDGGSRPGDPAICGERGEPGA